MTADLSESEDDTSTADEVADKSLLLKEAAAKWILKTRECFQIPQSTMETIIHDITSLQQVRCDQRIVSIDNYNVAV